MAKSWRCTVCGYIHSGDEPPEVCPVCGVDASKFELVSTAGAEPAAAEGDKMTRLKSAALALFDEMRATFVPHAVFAHFPNALLPTTVLFLLLFIISGQSSFETTSFYLLLVALLSIPPTFAAGIYDWRKRYAGELTPIFRKKIILGLVLLVLASFAAVWRLLSPEVLSSGGFSACAYSILIFIMLGCVTLLGHYGGTLVFSKHGK
jgi:uncharacterized membrane protein